MNPAGDPLAKFEELISQKNSGVICLPENPSKDSVASALVLYHALVKLGKNITVVCSTGVKSDVPGSDKIQSSFSNSGNNLVISLPYEEGSIDKVDYNIQGDYFNLIITPHEGFDKFDSKNVKYSYAGGDVDFIITIDTQSLKTLGQIYTDNQKKFQEKPVVNIDRHLTNSFFGNINMVSKTISSTSEIILSILNALSFEIDREMATALYTGLVAATNNFTSFSVNAGTFETAASLLKMGASKKGKQNNDAQRAIGIEKQKDKPIESVEKEIQIENDDETPEDWLKPKIFRSKNLS